MNRILLILFLFIYNQNLLFAQNDTIIDVSPVKKKSFLRRSIVPLSMIGSGLIINYSSGSIG